MLWRKWIQTTSEVCQNGVESGLEYLSGTITEFEMMGQKGESGCQGFFSESAGRRPREISFLANSIWLGVRVEEGARGREPSKIS